MDELKIRLITRLFMGVGGALMSLSDNALAWLFTRVQSLISDPGIREGLGEFIDVLRGGPPSTMLIRRMIRESNYEELHDFIAGLVAEKPMDIEKI